MTREETAAALGFCSLANGLIRASSALTNRYKGGLPLRQFFEYLMAGHAMSVGELFILGYFGKTIPAWLKEFAARYGLGGVILFDYSCQTQKYDNNIESPEQVRAPCVEIAALPSAPMVFIDQEGGLVRRLKERAFAPLPSAKEFNALSLHEKRKILAASFGELRALGIQQNFAPVIDVDYNPDNPNIGFQKGRIGGRQSIAGCQPNDVRRGAASSNSSRDCHSGIISRSTVGLVTKPPVPNGRS
jgi:hypothetical protein